MPLMVARDIFRYRPNNGALLYYQAFLMVERPSHDLVRQLGDFCDGRTEPTNEVKEYAARHRIAVELAMAAAKLPKCDWGLDYSQGMLMPLGHLDCCKHVEWAALAEAQILTSEGKYKQALNRCIVVLKMANHLSKGTLICYLLGLSIMQTANRCVQSILGKLPVDSDLLSSFEEDLAKTRRPAFSFKDCVEIELECLRMCVRKDSADKIFDPDFNEWAKERLPKEPADFALKQPDEFFKRNEKTWNEYAGEVRAAVELPYPEAFMRLKSLCEKARQEADTVDGAMTGLFAPNFHLVLTVHTRTRTLSNAIRAAVGVYLAQARTGKLPDKPPRGSPKDMFSGKDFAYEKTSDGFMLRCKGKDLVRNEVHQYEFKAAKQTQ